MFENMPVDIKIQRCAKHIRKWKQMNLFNLERINIESVDDLPTKEKQVYQQGWEAGLLMAESILETCFPEIEID